MYTLQRERRGMAGRPIDDTEDLVVPDAGHLSRSEQADTENAPITDLMRRK
jgi:hypothetical protein